MRDLDFYALECMEELDKIGIEYGNILEVIVNKRAKNRWGQCCKVPGGYKININVALLDESISDNGLINTLFHELLHSCDGCMNHGPEWKRLAFKVYLATGQKITRTKSATEMGVDRAADETYRYAVKCECCGRIIYKQKMCELVRNPERWKHKTCGGNFIRVK